MAESTNRLAQFEKMAHDDPNNELGHFSLGREYLTAGRHQEAIASFERALSLNAKLSKAYQLLAMALLKLNRRDDAVQRLTEGVLIADERGEMLPKNEMIRSLQDLGAPVPALKSAPVAAQAVGEGEVLCQRCGRVARRLPKPPFSNAIGKQIFEKICADCWKEWIGMGTKVINELRLPLSDPQAQKIFDQHMMEFLNLG